MSGKSVITCVIVIIILLGRHGYANTSIIRLIVGGFIRVQA